VGEKKEKRRKSEGAVRSRHYLFDLNPVKFNPFSSRFVRIPPDWEPEVASDLPSRRGVRFGGGFGEIARVLTLPLF